MAARQFNEAQKAYQIDTATDGVTYIRYNSADVGDIKRIVEDNGVVTISWAHGSWSNRENLAYKPNGATINE